MPDTIFSYLRWECEDPEEHIYKVLDMHGFKLPALDVFFVCVFF